MRESAPGLVLDTGALLAVERGRLTAVLLEAESSRLPVRISGGAVAQAWRGGHRSARLAALLRKRVDVVALDELEGRRVGELIVRAKLPRKMKPDVVDAHAALMALMTRSLVVTSDPRDLLAYGVPSTLVMRV